MKSVVGVPMRYLSKMIILFCSVLYSCTTQPAKSFEPRINHNRINCVAEPCDGSEASEEESNQSGDTCMITAPEQREECTGAVKSEPYECGASIGQVVDARIYYLTNRCTTCLLYTSDAADE